MKEEKEYRGGLYGSLGGLEGNFIIFLNFIMGLFVILIQMNNSL